MQREAGAQPISNRRDILPCLFYSILFWSEKEKQVILVNIIFLFIPEKIPALIWWLWLCLRDKPVSARCKRRTRCSLSPDTPPAAHRWRLSACCPSCSADSPITQLHHTGGYCWFQIGFKSTQADMFRSSSWSSHIRAETSTLQIPEFDSPPSRRGALSCRGEGDFDASAVKRRCGVAACCLQVLLV